MNDENTLLDPQKAGSTSGQQSQQPSQPKQQTQPQQPAQPKAPTPGMGVGEKAAYAAGGAVFGAGMAVAGQTMAANRPTDDEITAEVIAAPGEYDEEEVTAEFAATEPAPDDAYTGPETQAYGDNASAAASVRPRVPNPPPVPGQTTEPVENTTSNPPAAQEQTGTSSQTTYTTPTTQDIENAPDPADTIVATATGVRVAQVNDDVSFSRAFADARSQVGPGGVFEWHGRVYATYYKEEWEAMTPAQRHEFQNNIDYSDVIRDNTHNHGGSTHTTHNVTDDDNINDHNVDDHDPLNLEGSEVRVLAVGTTDLNEDDVPENAAVIEVDGREILIVDYDWDNNPDLAIIVDPSGNPTVYDISGTDIQMPTEDMIDSSMAYNNPPDYMNDADITNFA